MEQSLKGKCAVITGAGSGIGRCVAVQLAKEGMKIVLLGGKRLEALKETEKQVNTYGECCVIPGDLTMLGNLKEKVELAVEKVGGIDVLINNAGLALNSSFEETTQEQFDAIMKINVQVPYFLTQYALPYLKKSQAATVINIASVVGHSGYPMQSAYVASKHALLGFTKSLAREYYKENIRVHAICPGGVYTEMVKVARPDLLGEGMIMPEDIAEIILFLLRFRNHAVIDEINVHRQTKEPFLIS